MNQAEYNKLPGVNWSHLRRMRTSPLHYKYYLNVEIADTSLMRMGRASHCLALEPSVFDTRHPVFDGASRRGKAWDAYVADHPGTDPADILIESERERVNGGAQALLMSEAFEKYIRGGTHEVVLRWTDPETSLLCKGRADTIKDRIVDLKFVSDISRLEQTASAMGWHGQLAYYHDGANKMMNILFKPPVIVCVESIPPHAVVYKELPEPTVDIGRNLYKRLLQKVADCTESGIWPGPESGELWLPSWAEDEANADRPKLDFSGLPRMEEEQDATL